MPSPEYRSRSAHMLGARVARRLPSGKSRAAGLHHRLNACVHIGLDAMAYNAFSGVERVTRIELALSAWEAQRLRLPGVLTWRSWRPRVTVVDPSSPWLMAR